MKKLNYLFGMLLPLLWVSCHPASYRFDSEKNWIWIHANAEKQVEEWRADFGKYRNAGIDAILVGANTQVLQTVIPIAHETGLEVHAWMWTLNRHGDSIAQHHPEWYDVNQLGVSCFDQKPYVDYYSWVCPSVPEVQQHILNQVEQLLEIEGLDGIHLDYVRYSDAILPSGLWSHYGLVQDKVYPEWDYGYHPENIRQFEALYGYSPLNIPDPCADSAWVNFRLGTVTTLVNKIADLVHSRHKMVSAAVFPSPALSREMVYQAWDDWNLDAAMPMVYHQFYGEQIPWVGKITAEDVRAVGNRFPVYTGLFLPDLPVDSLKLAIKLVMDSGAKGYALFDEHAFEKIATQITP